MKQLWSEQQSEHDVLRNRELISMGKMPRHCAIIMDGNGRWAQERSKPRVAGHEEGIESVRDIVKVSSQLEIKYLTLYAFSMENWKRPQPEVNVLMVLLERYLRQEIQELHDNNVRLNAIGKLNALPKRVNTVLHEAMEKTKNNTGLHLTLALSYSGRWDVNRAVQLIAHDVRRGKLSPEDITEEHFATYLQTHTMPDPDLVIRTSGEMRLSNFLLWETAYSEIYVTECMWPEFRRNAYYEALRDYMTRERRFGKTSAQIHNESSKSVFQKVMDAFHPLS